MAMRSCFGLILLALLLSTVFNAPAAVPSLQSVRLAWATSLSPNVTGYKIYYGTKSHSYTNAVNAGNTSAVTVPNLVPGVTYYFTATAYNVAGLESIPSDEINYTVVVSSQCWLYMNAPITPGAPAVLSGIGRASHTYEIQATTTLSSWNVLGNATSGPDGSFQYTDSGSRAFPHRFYRARDTQP